MGWWLLLSRLPLPPRASPMRAARGTPQRLLPLCLFEEKPKPHPLHLQKPGSLASLLRSLGASKQLVISQTLWTPRTAGAWRPASGRQCPQWHGALRCLLCWSRMRFTNSWFRFFESFSLADARGRATSPPVHVEFQNWPCVHFSKKSSSSPSLNFILYHRATGTYKNLGKFCAGGRAAQ